MSHINDTDSERFIDRMLELGPFPDRDTAIEAAEATFDALGERLSKQDKAVMCRELPALVTAFLQRSSRERTFDRNELYDCVAERLYDVSLGNAVEQANIAVQVLGEWLSRSTLDVVRRNLPDLADLFRSEPLGAALDGRAKALEAPDARHSLAEGQPGSSRPLASARPDRAHADSVARSDAPHADTKLSTSRGLTQEREGSTLAAGRPGSKRPLGG